jgi:hypothetical protein
VLSVRGPSKCKPKAQCGQKVQCVVARCGDVVSRLTVYLELPHTLIPCGAVL